MKFSAMNFPKIPFRKKKVKDFLLIEIGLEVVNMAKLSMEGEPKIVEVGRKSFPSLKDMFNASLEAIDDLAGKTSDIPNKAILGVSGGPIKTETTVAQYSRPEPNDPVDSREIEKVLEEVSVKSNHGDLKLFFSTVVSANVDGTKVSNPIGIKGEKIALSCFIAFKHPEEIAVFDKLVNEIDMNYEKIIPTSYAVAKMLLAKGNENTLLLRVGKNKSEASFLTKGHINEILQFDLGSANPELLEIGLEVALEKMSRESLPEHIYLYPDHAEVDLSEFKERLSNFPWSNFHLKKPPYIEVAISNEENLSEDIGLKALSFEAREE